MQNVQLNLRYHYLRVFQCHYIFCVFPHIKYHLVSKHYGILITSVKWGNYEQKKHKHTSTFIWQQTDESCFFSPDRCSIAAGVHFSLAYCYMNPFSWRYYCYLSQIVSTLTHCLCYFGDCLFQMWFIEFHENQSAVMFYQQLLGVRVQPRIYFNSQSHFLMGDSHRDTGSHRRQVIC